MNWLPRKTVVVPIDFSEDSFTAMDVAGRLGFTQISIATVNDPVE